MTLVNQVRLKVHSEKSQYYYTVKKVYMDLERGLVKAIFAKSPVIAGSLFYYEYDISRPGTYLFEKSKKVSLLCPFNFC